MNLTETVLLSLVFFATSALSVVTGSTSVITVPVMLEMGFDPRIAVATNMFALTFMSIGGTLPFLRGPVLNRSRLPKLAVLTLLGSIGGAMLLLTMAPGAIRAVVSIAAIALAVFSTVHRHAASDTVQPTTDSRREMAGYVLTFLLGIYGGLFSGGYVTILTMVFVTTFRMSFIEAIAATKLMNVFSSGVATLLFMQGGLVNYKLGIILAAVMFCGAWLGARYAKRLSDRWLRRIYLTAVWFLGLKALMLDLLRNPSPARSEP